MKRNDEKLKQAILLAAQEDGRALLDADRAEPCEPASPEARARLFATVERAKKPSAARHRFTPAAKRAAIAVAAAAVALVVIFASPGQGDRRMDGLSETASPSAAEAPLPDYEAAPYLCSAYAKSALRLSEDEDQPLQNDCTAQSAVRVFYAGGCYYSYSVGNMSAAATAHVPEGKTAVGSLHTFAINNRSVSIKALS